MIPENIFRHESIITSGIIMLMGSEGKVERPAWYSCLSLKWIALVALVLQNAGLAVTMRYTMISVKPGEAHYITSTAVLVAEVMKLVISTAICYIVDAKSSWPAFSTILFDEFITNR